MTTYLYQNNENPSLNFIGALEEIEAHIKENFDISTHQGSFYAFSDLPEIPALTSFVKTNLKTYSDFVKELYSVTQNLYDKSDALAFVRLYIKSLNVAYGKDVYFEKSILNLLSKEDLRFYEIELVNWCDNFLDEAPVGFEPTNRSFADFRLGPLGYSAL